MADPTRLQDRDAEMACLGAMLMQDSVIDDVLAELPESDAFFVPQHRDIFQAIADFHENANQRLDVVTFNAWLTANGRLDRLGGTDYLIRLAESYADVANAVHYAKIVRGLFARRSLWSIATALASEVCDPVNEPDVETIVTRAWRRADAAIIRSRRQDIETIDSVAKRVPAWLGEQDRATLRTGFAQIDSLIGGMPRPGYVILAARPSMGKTSLGLAFALHVTHGCNVPSLFVSLETPKLRLASRALAMETGVPIGVYRHQWSPADFQGAADAYSRRFEGAKLYLADDLDTIDQIVTRTRSMIRSHGVGLLVIDYLQLVQGRRDAETRNLEIQEISRTLRRLTLTEELTVLALAQLRRDAEGRKPGLHDLRESGSLEQDADLIFFLYAAGFREAICIDVAKNKDGPLGSWTARFHGATTSFSLDAVEPASQVGPW